MDNGASRLSVRSSCRSVRILFLLSFSLYCGCRQNDPPSIAPLSETEHSETDSESEFFGTEDLPPARVTDWFEDVSDRSGVIWRHSSGRRAGRYTMLEVFGSGVGLLDYDVDGDLDLLVSGGGFVSPDGEISGAGCALFRNLGGFQFEDVTAESSLGAPIDYSHGIAVGDVNDDGLPDAFIACFGRSRLFLNIDGKSFRDVTEEMGVSVEGWYTSACFADVTADGRPDLYVTGYLDWLPNPAERCTDPKSGRRDVCMPGAFAGVQDRLLVASDAGRFSDESLNSGIRSDGRGLGVVAGDFNGDSRVDLYVANDVERNHLYLNSGKGAFVEAAERCGVAGNEFGAAEGSMGVHAGDFNHDGKPDLVVTNYELEENSLYRNEGGEVFSHITVSSGLAGRCRPMVGFGTVLADFNSDGWQDLVVVNGHVTYHNRKSPFRQEAVIFRNVAGARFEDIGDAAGNWFSVPHSARGLAAGDLNNDGAPDLVVTGLDSAVSILRNQHPPKFWLGVQLRGTAVSSAAVGSRVRIIGLPESVFQTVYSGGSYLSHNDQRICFPLPNVPAAPLTVEVTWPDHSSEIFHGLDGLKYHVLQQGDGRSVASMPRNDTASEE